MSKLLEKSKNDSSAKSRPEIKLTERNRRESKHDMPKWNLIAGLKKTLT